MLRFDGKNKLLEFEYFSRENSLVTLYNQNKYYDLIEKSICWNLTIFLVKINLNWSKLNGKIKSFDVDYPNIVHVS